MKKRVRIRRAAGRDTGDECNPNWGGVGREAWHEGAADAVRTRDQQRNPMTKSESIKTAALEQMSCITAADNSLGAWCRGQARAALEAAAKAPDCECGADQMQCQTCGKFAT